VIFRPINYIPKQLKIFIVLSNKTEVTTDHKSMHSPVRSGTALAAVRARQTRGSSFCTW